MFPINLSVKNKPIRLGLISLILTFLISNVFFSEYWSSPAKFFFNAQGDGLKNYFTVIYHSKYGQGWSSQGLHYPYSESIFFIDGLPLISFPLSVLNDFFDPTTSAIFIINFLLLISTPLAAFFLSRILSLLHVGSWINPLGASLIALMSPQIYKLTGHYGLGISVLIPAAIYLLLRTSKVNDSLLLILLLSIAGLVHPYLLGIILLLATSYLIFASIYQLLNWKVATGIFILLVIFSIVYAFLLKLIDPFVSREQYQVATQFFLANWKTLLVPYDLRKWGGIAEGEIYLGIVPVCLALLRISRSSNQEKVLIWTGSVMIILSLGLIPILNSILSDLRALARLSWGAYYILGLLAVVQLIHWAKQDRVCQGLMLFCILLWGFDVTRYLQHVQQVIYVGRAKVADFNLQLPNDWHQKYQGIIPIPYYSIGANSVFIAPPSLKSFWDSMRVSIAIGPGLMSPFSAKGADKEFAELAGIVAHPLSQRKILDKLDSRPLLIVQSSAAVNESENILINSAKKIEFADPTLQLFEITPAELRQQSASFTFNDCQYDDVVYQNFDQSNAIGFIGVGGLFMPARNVVLFQGLIRKDFPLEISLWVKNSYRNDLKLVVEAGGLLKEQLIPNSVERVGDWVRLTVNLPAPKQEQNLRVWLTGEPTVIDEFLIRRIGTTICREDHLSLNNYPLNLK